MAVSSQRYDEPGRECYNCGNEGMSAKKYKKGQKRLRCDTCGAGEWVAMDA